MAEIVAVLVGVAAPVAVAVHLNGNATVSVIGLQELARLELAGSVPAMQRDFATVPMRSGGESKR